MNLSFTKMTGCGNDYIYLNGFDPAVSEILKQQNLSDLIVSLSDRHFGIGGDGVVLILPADGIADARMRMFNLDGSEGDMCGNAIRCVAKYLFDRQIVSKRTIVVATLSGIKTLFLTLENDLVTSVKVDMGAAILSPAAIPVALNEPSVIDYPIVVDGKTYAVTCVSMGNPHAVLFFEPDLEPLESLDLVKIGPSFEHHLLFPNRINTEFVTLSGKNHLKMRVWERGSGETLACGTGACAAAVVAVLTGRCDKDTDIQVDLLGGTLTIHYTDHTVWMTGGCTTIFDGIIAV